VRLGLTGGAGLVAVALLVAAVTRLVGGDGAAALGNASLLLGMATMGIATLAGGRRVSRRRELLAGGVGLQRARGTPDPARGLLRLSLAIAGAVPFALFVALAASH